MKKTIVCLAAAVLLSCGVKAQNDTVRADEFKLNIEVPNLKDTTIVLDGAKIEAKGGVLTVDVPKHGEVNTLSSVYAGLSEEEKQNAASVIALLEHFLGVEIEDESLADLPKKTVRKKKSSFDGSWAGLEFGYLNFADFMGEYDDPYRLSGGWRFAWNFFEVEIPFSYRCGLVTGLGYQSNIFYAKTADAFSAQLFKPREGDVPSLEGFASATEAKLVARYLTLPLLFEVQSSNGKMAFSVGAVAGWNFYSRLKAEGEVNGRDVCTKNEDKSDFNLNDFNAEATMRFTYKCLQVYANLALTPMFDTDVHNSIMPYSIGLSLCF